MEDIYQIKIKETNTFLDFVSSFYIPNYVMR